MPQVGQGNAEGDLLPVTVTQSNVNEILVHIGGSRPFGLQFTDSAATAGHAESVPLRFERNWQKRRTGDQAFSMAVSGETIGKRSWVRANGVMAAESETRRHLF